MANVELRGLGHTELCHDGQVYAVVRRELRATAALWRERSSHLESGRMGVPTRGWDGSS